jgi:pimeloyl-ACP methyl ester carboxylesterase
MRLKLADTDVGGFIFEWLRGLTQEETGGALLGECLGAANAIREGDFSNWTKVWASLAKGLFEQATTSQRSGNSVTAKEVFLRASNYYRMAAFYADPEEPNHQTLFEASRSSFHKAIECGLPVEPIEIPFKGHRLPGYFIRSCFSPAPTLIAHGGFDSTAEELYHWIGVHATPRNWNCLIFEGPGQWGPVFDEPPLLMRPDWEVPVHAVVDYALTRPEIDSQRLALIGYSLGGYLAPRAAALEPRIRACVASPIAVDIGTAFRTAWPSFVQRFSSTVLFDFLMAGIARMSVSSRWAIQHGRWVMGIKRPRDFFKAWKPYTLHGLETRLRSPLLVLLGEDDLANMPTALIMDTIDFMSQLQSLREIRVFSRRTGGAPHCQIGAVTAAAASTMDWLDTIFRAPDKSPSFVVPDAAIELLRKHHGARAVEYARQAVLAGSQKLNLVRQNDSLRDQ